MNKPYLFTMCLTFRKKQNELRRRHEAAGISWRDFFGVIKFEITDVSKLAILLFFYCTNDENLHVGSGTFGCFCGDALLIWLYDIYYDHKQKQLFMKCLHLYDWKCRQYRQNIISKKKKKNLNITYSQWFRYKLYFPSGETIAHQGPTKIWNFNYLPKFIEI